MFILYERVHDICSFFMRGCMLYVHSLWEGACYMFILYRRVHAICAFFMQKSEDGFCALSFCLTHLFHAPGGWLDKLKQTGVGSCVMREAIL